MPPKNSSYCPKESKLFLSSAEAEGPPPFVFLLPHTPLPEIYNLQGSLTSPLRHQYGPTLIIPSQSRLPFCIFALMEAAILQKHLSESVSALIGPFYTPPQDEVVHYYSLRTYLYGEYQIWLPPATRHEEAGSRFLADRGRPSAPHPGRSRRSLPRGSNCCPPHCSRRNRNPPNLLRKPPPRPVGYPPKAHNPPIPYFLSYRHS